MLTAYTWFFSAGIIAWGYPFASFAAYFVYNAGHGTEYTTGPFYNYILLLIGLLIPPVSIMLLYGFGRFWKKYYIIILPVLTFLIFHSIYPNKQERFILPIVPLIVVLGITGWEGIVSNSGFWLKRKAILKGCWIWFWCVNSILMLLFTFTYSKKTRCESLYYLSDKKDISGIFISGWKLGTIQPPIFYLNKYDVPVLSLESEDKNSANAENFYKPGFKFPNYIIFFGSENIIVRERTFEKSYNKNLEIEKIIEPSLADNIFYKLNPKFNNNETAYIFRIE